MTSPAAIRNTLLTALLLVAPLAGAAEQTVIATQIREFRGKPVGSKVDGLIWQGGLVLESASDQFGGLSSISFTGPEHRLAMVTDRGNFVSGQLLYEEDGRPLGLVGVTIEPMQNSKGAELPRQFARDAESVDTIIRDGAPVGVRVGFENLTRVADFGLIDGRPGGPAREVPIPDWLEQSRTNESLESLCVAPPASPVAGSTLLIAERVLDADGNQRAALLGNRDKGDLALAQIEGLNPSDCAFLPNGDLLVLERGIAFFTFTMRLLRVPAAEVRAGNVMRGEVLLTASGNDIDNMEGVAVHTGPDGRPRITLISDNNFNGWERSLLLDFSLPE